MVIETEGGRNERECFRKQEKKKKGGGGEINKIKRVTERDGRVREVNMDRLREKERGYRLRDTERERAM